MLDRPAETAVLNQELAERTGGSAGDYRVGFNDLPSDTIAAVRYLRGRRSCRGWRAGWRSPTCGGMAVMEGREKHSECSPR